MRTPILQKQGLEILWQSHFLDSETIEDNFFLNALMDEQGMVLDNILINNCVFLNNFGAQTGSFKEKLIIRNCVIHGHLIFFGIFTYKTLLIENCRCCGITQLCGGGFYNDVALINNVFEGFVDFGDQDIQGQSIFINNRFNSGTNLMHPLGGPNGAHFTLRPHLEGNIGLERYERPLRSETNIADAG